MTIAPPARPPPRPRPRPAPRASPPSSSSATARPGWRRRSRPWRRQHRRPGPPRGGRRPARRDAAPTWPLTPRAWAGRVSRSPSCGPMRATTFGGCVALAVARLDADGVAASALDWLWLLHDDGAPSARGARLMLDAARQSPAIAHRRTQAHHLVRRGPPAGGRPAPSPAAGAGPAAPPSASPTRASTTPGPTSSASAAPACSCAATSSPPSAASNRPSRPHADDLDLCWRAHLAGHRVVVVPAAQVREAAAPPSGQRAGAGDAQAVRRAERRQERQVALTRSPLAAAPLLALWVLLSACGLLPAAAPAQAAAAGPGRAGRRRGPAAPLADDRRPVARPRPATGPGPRPARAVRAAAGRRPGHRRQAP